jgi:hypothetical protein
LYSKLEAGDYEGGVVSRRRKNADTIKVFRNNLNFFKQYKVSDDISWVLHQHRLLAVEILFYYANYAAKSGNVCISNYQEQI